MLSFYASGDGYGEIAGHEKSYQWPRLSSDQELLVRGMLGVLHVTQQLELADSREVHIGLIYARPEHMNCSLLIAEGEALTWIADHHVEISNQVLSSRI